jgi:adenylylsulfate kinase-like enzyme
MQKNLPDFDLNQQHPLISRQMHLQVLELSAQKQQHQLTQNFGFKSETSRVTYFVSMSRVSSSNHNNHPFVHSNIHSYSEKREMKRKLLHYDIIQRC